MVPASLAFLLALWLLFFSLDPANSSDQVSNTNVQPSPTAACVDCTICPYPCHKLSPPPPLNGAPPPPPSQQGSGYPIYGAPPPPPSQQGSGYPIYGAPPPPQVQGNCPPGQVQCCGGTGNTGTGTGTPPPSIYTYLPNDSYSALYHSTIPIFSIVILIVSFAVLF